MTVIERLTAMSVPESEAHDALVRLGHFVPVDRADVLTVEILSAALSDNIAYLRALLAEEDDAAEDERSLLDELGEEDYRDTVTIAL